MENLLSVVCMVYTTYRTWLCIVQYMHYVHLLTCNVGVTASLWNECRFKVKILAGMEASHWRYHEPRRQVASCCWGYASSTRKKKKLAHVMGPREQDCIESCFAITARQTFQTTCPQVYVQAGRLWPHVWRHCDRSIIGRWDNSSKVMTSHPLQITTHCHKNRWL